MKLINDDCMNVLPTLADRSINLVVCDLPYDCDKTRASWDKSLDLAAFLPNIVGLLSRMAQLFYSGMNHLVADCAFLTLTFTNMILSGLKIYRLVLQTPTIAL